MPRNSRDLAVALGRDLSRSLQRNLEHLRPPPTRGGKSGMPIPSHFRPPPKFVQVKDRVPYWHFAPGDRVKLIKGDERVKGKVGVIERVDRETNRVYLAEPEFAAKKRSPNEYPGQQTEPGFTSSQDTYSTPRPFHISNLRLQVRDGGKEYTSTRVRRTEVGWDATEGKYVWKRLALVPDLASEEASGWREVPWPEEEKPTHQKGALDAAEAEILRTSWTPDISKLSLAPSRNSAPKNPSRPLSLPADAPPELHVGQLDLGGAYWSRAKRQERFQEKKAQEKQYGKKVMKIRSKELRKAAARLAANGSAAGRRAGASEIELVL
ncbi:hypothetical protein JCM10908_006918 [Rhodotorula pacifica]|uniref:KOW motif domain-containing protein n=1 Tax=Rhodotorula pacifica TaxID=1495444 RepID=UPI0031711284